MPDELRVSVSKTKCFNQCKKQFEFSYILKFPKKERDYHIFGKFCHDVLEKFHSYYIEGCLLPHNIAMGNAFKSAWAQYKDKMTPEMKKECWTIINEYLLLIAKDKHKHFPSNVIAVEKKFELPIDEKIILNGAIDRIQLDDDGILHVADYKTSKNKKYLKNDWFQLLTYAYVMLNEDPAIKKVRASYIMLRHGFEYITTEFDVEQILQAKEKLLECAHQMMTEKDFEPTVSQLCSWCDFVEHCGPGRAQAAGQFGQSKKIYGEVGY